jgi:type IX secretion system PorP/SprF family membrane protein
LQTLKKLIYILLLLLNAGWAFGQQYPYWTQSRSNYFLVNPAVAGTRKTLDVRANYRYQWAGFADAPKTMSLGAHSRFYKGKMGAGMFLFQDRIGPQKVTTVAGAYSFHLKFEDTEFSFGVNGSYNVNGIDASKVDYLNTHDQVIFNAITYNKARIFNMAAGLLLYNEHFYVGLSMNNMTGMSYNFREKKKSKNVAELTTVPHFAIGAGYNWAEDPDFIWENTLMANFVQGTPLLLDYNFKLHLKNTVYMGAGIRLKTCIYGQIGYTIKGIGQIGYSYDFNTNALMKTNTGSHEFKLVYVFDASSHVHHGNNSFQHKHFQYLL